MSLSRLYYLELAFKKNYLSSGERLPLISILDKISLYMIIRLRLLFFLFLRILYTLS